MPDVTVKAADGSSFGAYLATPPSGSGPGLVVIQEIFGVNANIRALADAYAKQGYIAIAPDLFWRIEPGVQLTDKSKAEWDKAFALMNAFDFQKGVADIQATLAYVRAQPGCTGKAGAVGYCLGGSLAYGTACFTDTDASVGYYPVQIENSLDASRNIKKPLMLHMAERDQFCPPEAQKKIYASLIGFGHISIHTYPGCDHAFAREGGEHYDKAAADLANGRTAAFLDKNLK